MIQKFILLRRRHARERAALRARQTLELALAVCANSLTAEQQARRAGISQRQVMRLRKVWREYDATKDQPWEPCI